MLLDLNVDFYQIQVLGQSTLKFSSIFWHTLELSYLFITPPSIFIWTSKSLQTQLVSLQSSVVSVKLGDEGGGGRQANGIR